MDPVKRFFYKSEKWKTDYEVLKFVYDSTYKEIRNKGLKPLDYDELDGDPPIALYRIDVIKLAESLHIDEIRLRYRLRYLASHKEKLTDFVHLIHPQTKAEREEYGTQYVAERVDTINFDQLASWVTNERERRNRTQRTLTLSVIAILISCWSVGWSIYSSTKLNQNSSATSETITK